MFIQNVEKCCGRNKTMRRLNAISKVGYKCEEDLVKIKKGYSFSRITLARNLLFIYSVIQTTASGADGLLRLSEYSQGRFCC